jgi:hypothetical protein
MGELGVLPMNDRELILRYLLGQMSEPERLEVQDRLFSDDEFCDSIAEVETDLIDAYARGELTPAEREQMEQSILASPAARKRVEFAAALAGVAPAGALRSDKPVASQLQWIAAAAVVVLAIAAGILSLQNRDLRNKIAAFQNQRQVDDTLRKEQVTAPSVFTVLLEPGVVRGSERVREIAIPPTSQFVQLQLDLHGDVRDAYQGRLSAGGRNIWELSHVLAERKTQGVILPFWIPANLLSSGPFELAVMTGNGEPLEFYYFRVTSR